MALDFKRLHCQPAAIPCEPLLNGRAGIGIIPTFVEVGGETMKGSRRFSARRPASAVWQAVSSFTVAMRIEGEKAVGQKRFGKLKLCIEGRDLDPGELVAGTMLHQDLAILSRLQQLVIDQGVSIDDVVKGAIDLAIKAP